MAASASISALRRFIWMATVNSLSPKDMDNPLPARAGFHASGRGHAAHTGDRPFAGVGLNGRYTRVIST